MEPLEDRWLLATFMVGNLNDAGEGSLRQAILDANSTVGADTIEFAAVAGTIALTSGEIEITEAVTIDGPGDDVLTIDAQQNSRIFNISALTGDFAINGLTLTGGRTIGDNPTFYDSTFNGGAVRAVTTGNLTITNCTVSGNSTAGYVAAGGGVYAYGNVTLTNSTISGNHTLGERAYGGGIYALDLTLIQSSVSGNHTAGLYAGGGGIASYGNVTLTDSTVIGNHTEGDSAAGGGIFAVAALVLNQSSVSGNHTAGENAVGGGIYCFANVSLNNSTVSGNHTVAANAAGGGIYSVGDVALVESTVTGNYTMGEVAQGGGIFGRANVTLTISTVSGNHTEGYAARGGGIRSNAGVTLTNSNVIENQTAGEAATGAGIRAESPVTLTNSTVSGNQTAGDFAFGGGVFTYGDVTLNSSTVTGNHTAGEFANGAGIFVGQYGTLTLTNSIVAGNTADDGRPDLWLIGSIPPVLRHSLVGNNFGALLLAPAPLGSPDSNGNFIGTAASPIDPLLGPLADNGGPTMTHVPLAGSPVVDAGDPGFNPADPDGDPMTDDAMPFDQRGAPFARVIDGNGAGGAQIDMGATEFVPTAVLHTLFGDYNQDDTVNAADYTVYRNMSGQTGLTRYDGADGNGDGMITRLDYDVWNEHYGETVPASAAAVESAANASLVTVEDVVVRERAPFGRLESVDDDRAIGVRLAAQRTLNPALSQRERELNSSRESEGRDAALLAWFETQFRSARPFGDDGMGENATEGTAGPEERAARIGAFDLAIEGLGRTKMAAWQSEV